MFSNKYYGIIFSLFMALLMSGIMSFVISILNIGLDNQILKIWLKAWGGSFVVAFPTRLIMTPFVKYLIEILIEKDINQSS